MSSARKPCSRLAIFALLGVLLAALVGCEKETITSYKAPRLHRRLLAAVVRNGDTTWFIKLVGASEAVAEHKDEFERFVRSVRFPDKDEEMIAWDAPESWTSEPNSEMRYATFRVGKSGLELTVVKLPGEAGSLPANVNRWRGQLGLPSIGEDELAPLTRREVTPKAGPVTFVDLTTAEAPRAERPAPKPEPRAGGDLKYELPEGWKDLGGGGIRKAAFEVRDGNDKAETTIISATGALVPNVQRWQTQVGLEPGSEEQIKKDLQSIEAAGGKRPYVDIAGPSGKRILAVVIETPRQTWFVKMMGPTALVGKQKPAFEALVRSLKFDGDRGAE
jgi:hypothetical protein